MFHRSTRSAVVWTLGGSTIAQILRFGSNLMLTRLLVPEMFGVMALANALLIGLMQFSDVGLQQKVVQRESIDPEFLDSIWSVQILRGLVIFIFLGCSAVSLYAITAMELAVLPGAFAHPSLPMVIASLGVVGLLSGFSSTKLYSAARERNVGAITRIELTAQVFSIIVMIVYATITPTISALVWGNLLGALVRCVLSHVALPGERNRLRLRRDYFREIWYFGRWIAVSSIMSFLALYGDRFIIGGFVDASTLGVLAIALVLIEAARGVIGQLIDNVGFPVLSDAARIDQEALRKKLVRGQGLLDIVVPSAAGILCALGPPLVVLLYDERYESAGSYLALLSLSLYAQRYTLAAQVLLVMGKTKAYSMRSIVEAIFVMVFVPVGFILYGVAGSLLATVIARFLIAPYLMIAFRNWNVLTFVTELRAATAFGVSFLLARLLSSLAGF